MNARAHAAKTSLCLRVCESSFARTCSVQRQILHCIRQTHHRWCVVCLSVERAGERGSFRCIRMDNGCSSSSQSERLKILLHNALLVEISGAQRRPRLCVPSRCTRVRARITLAEICIGVAHSASEPLLPPTPLPPPLSRAQKVHFHNVKVDKMDGLYEDACASKLYEAYTLRFTCDSLRSEKEKSHVGELCNHVFVEREFCIREDASPRNVGIKWGAFLINARLRLDGRR